jgi:phosphatidylglycerol:prolipoprotein diacylglycerol transferase
MQQVLLQIPLPWGTIPIFGFGVFLLIAFLVSFKLAAWRAQAVGIHPDQLWDIALLLFVTGIIGARLFFFLFIMQGVSWTQIAIEFFQICKGVLVF